jgi:hypothetical protein
MAHFSDLTRMNVNLKKLHDLGQSQWLGNINRELLTSGRVTRYIANHLITGLTSNPEMLEQAFQHGSLCYEDVGQMALFGEGPAEMYCDLALQDPKPAFDLLLPIFDATHAVDGWASLEMLLEVSPMLCDIAARTINPKPMAVTVQISSVCLVETCCWTTAASIRITATVTAARGTAFYGDGTRRDFSVAKPGSVTLNIISPRESIRRVRLCTGDAVSTGAPQRNWRAYWPGPDTHRFPRTQTRARKPPCRGAKPATPIR